MEGILSDLSRIEVHANKKEPKTRKKLMNLIGRLNLYHRILKNLSQSLADITDKLKGREKLNVIVRIKEQFQQFMI